LKRSLLGTAADNRRGCGACGGYSIRQQTLILLSYFRFTRSYQRLHRLHRNHQRCCHYRAS
jgi:hypothetical protein